MEFRRLSVGDWEQYKELRLLSLVQFPELFGNSVDDESTLNNEQWISRETPTQSSFIVGVFDGGTLIGSAGFAQGLKEKMKHKSFLWGVFVKQEYRDKHVAKKILNKLIQIASSNLEVSQIQLAVGSSK